MVASREPAHPAYPEAEDWVRAKATGWAFQIPERGNRLGPRSPAVLALPGEQAGVSARLIALPDLTSEHHTDD
ncbi:MAG TPA: hypothetical protein VH592_19315 [Gemmataceae bacterium]